jgi:hypothetical protein
MTRHDYDTNMKYDMRHEDIISICMHSAEFFLIIFIFLNLVWARNA